MSTLRSELALVFSDAQVHSSEAYSLQPTRYRPSKRQVGTRRASFSSLLHTYGYSTYCGTYHNRRAECRVDATLPRDCTFSVERDVQQSSWEAPAPAVGWIPALDRTSIRTEDMGMAVVACPTDKVQDDSSWFMALSNGPRTRAAQKAWLGRRPGLPLWQYQALDVGDSASDLPYSAPTSLSACARHDAADDHTVHRRALQHFVERLNLAPSPILSALHSRSLLLVDQKNNPYLLHTISRRRPPTRKQILPVSRSSASRPNAATLSAADVRSPYRDPRTSHQAAQGSQGH